MAIRILALIVALAAFAPPPAAAQSRSDLDAQLALLMDWWPGHYDNNEQIVRQSGGGLEKPVFEPISRLHSIHKRVDLPAIGDNVLYIEEYKNNDPDEIYRIRLLSLTVDEAAGALRGKLHAIKDWQRLIGAHADLARVEALSPDQVTAFSDACDILLEFEGAQFRGGMVPETCVVDDGWFQYEMTIGPKHYWFRDQRRALDDGRVVWELAPGSNYAFLELTKARWFSCTVNYNLDGDMTKTEFLTAIRLHDQGGEAPIAYPDGRDLTFIIHTRAFSSPPERTYPLFRIHETGNHVPIAYAYAVDDAERFGLNLGWFYTLCRVETDAPLPAAD